MKKADRGLAVTCRIKDEYQSSWHWMIIIYNEFIQAYIHIMDNIGAAREIFHSLTISLAVDVKVNMLYDFVYSIITCPLSMV